MGKIKVLKKGDCLLVCLKVFGREEIAIKNLLGPIELYNAGLLYPEKIVGNKIEYKSFKGESLKIFLQTPNLSRDILITIIEQFLILNRNLEARNMIGEYLVLDLENVFYDNETQHIKFIYTDLVKSKKKYFFENFIYAVLKEYKTDRTSDINFKRRLIDFLDYSQNNSITKTENFLYKENQDIIKKTQNNENNAMYRISIEKQQPIPVFSTSADKEEQTEFIEINEDLPTEFFEESESEEQTEFYQNIDEETFFSDIEFNKVSQYPTLTLKSKHETIQINKALFRIGRELGKVDYCIENNRNISRAHIDFIWRDQNLYVMDLNSKNRTFVNEREIPPSVEVEIRNGDVVRISDEEFICHF